MTSNRPAYRKVADEIRASAMDGTYAPGSLLPADMALAEQYDTNRSTIGQAVRLLLAEGYLIKKGRNYAVSPLLNKILRDAKTRYAKTSREASLNGIQARGAFDAEVRALGMRALSEVTVDRVAPPAKVAEILGVSADEVSVVSRARKMFADDIPVQLATSYIPGDIAFGTALEAVDSGPGGMVSRLADLGLPQTEIIEEINVRTPTAEEAEALDLAEDARVYELTHIAKTSDGRVVEVALHTMPTSVWTLRYGWQIESTS